MNIDVSPNVYMKHTRPLSATKIYNCYEVHQCFRLTIGFDASNLCQG